MIRSKLLHPDLLGQDFGVITGGLLTVVIPIVLPCIPLQKQVVSGLTAGSVKE
jgi:hypothetical protein